MKNSEILFVGGGNMGSAFVDSVVKNGIFAPDEIQILEKNQKKRELFEKKYGIATTSDSSATKTAKIIFLAIKPQNLHELPIDSGEKIVISILAGVKISKIAEKFPNSKIVRAMPNLGQFVRAGITGVFIDPTAKFTKNEKKLIREIFESGGKIQKCVRECELDEITAISGSGPAYFFWFAEGLVTAARKLGFSESDAEKLVRQTFVGAAKILDSHPNETVKIWRDRVTSRGGTTEAAIEIFENSDAKKIILDAVKSASDRARELGG